MTLAIAHSVDDGDQVAQSLRTRTFGTKSGDCTSAFIPNDYEPGPRPNFELLAKSPPSNPEIFYRIQRKSDRLWLILNVDQQPFWTPEERASRLFAERDVESATAIAELTAASDYDLVPFHLRRLTRVFELQLTPEETEAYRKVLDAKASLTARADDCRKAHGSD